MNLLNHVVLVTLKEETNKETINKIDTAFRTLESKIDKVISFVGGENNSPEGLDQGYSHGYVITFENEKDRDAYLVYKAHLEFVDLLSPALEKVCVLDFWSH